MTALTFRSRVLIISIIVVSSVSFCYWGYRYYYQHGADASAEDQEELKENLIKANRIITLNESDQIDEIVRSSGITMLQSGTGLRYRIFSEGAGKHPSRLDTVIIAYRLSLVNGVICYGLDYPDTLRFVMGTGGATNGLEEGLSLLKQGGKARLIVPSHLGFGLLGDGEKVPAKSILVYDVDLLEVKEGLKQ